MNVRIILRVLLLMAICVLASCKTPAPLPVTALLVTPRIISEAPVYPRDLRGAQLFRIAPAETDIHVLVYRGGTMANLGHNHVINSHSVNGFVWRSVQSDLCGFDIALPVNDLIVDDNDARMAEGDEFPVNVPDTAKQGTRHNMLSETLLDAEHFPFIRLQSANISGEIDSPRVVVHVTIKNQIHLYTLPVTISLASNSLRVRGEFQLRQTDFGIKPYSVAMGALQVQDELNIKFDLRAARVEPAPPPNVTSDDDLSK